MEFTVSDKKTLSGNEVWSADGASLSRTATQYLHFRTAVFNPSKFDRSLWLIIPFPAMKQLTLTDGLNTWQTGDAKIFSSRPIASPDYIFPVRLNANKSTPLTGHMQGEILRYTFVLSTPEYASANYRYNLSRDMAFFGAMVTLVVVCMVVFLATKYHAYLSFAAFACSLAAWFYRVFGYAFENLWPNHPEFNDISYTVLLYLVMLTSSWMIISILQRQNKILKYQNVLIIYTILLVIAGLFSSAFLSLDTTLLIPLYWFFPMILLILLIIYQEHKAGSIKAKWFAFSITPLTGGAMAVVIFGMGYSIDIDPVIALMGGVVSTCLLLTVMISTYLIKLLQSQRDDQQQQSLLKTQQAEQLEVLVKERTQELESSNHLLQELASIDPLTKLPNRRSLDLFVDDCIAQDYPSIGIAMLDLDHFKRINDTFGHDVGDIVLFKVGELLNPLNSDGCIAGRFGGEEFAIIVSQPSEIKFEQNLDILHSDINKITLDDYPDVQVKACIGWVICKRNESISECFRRADKALYQAKEQGRNQLVSAEYLLTS